MLKSSNFGIIRVKKIESTENEIMKLTIKRMGNDGEGIGFYENKPVYIYYAFLNEEVIVDVFTNKRGVFEGVLKEVVTPSEHRIDVSWPYYMESGSVNLLHLNYLEALNYKKYVIKRLVEKRLPGKIVINNTLPSEKIYHYRNKTDLPVIYQDGKNYMANYYRGSNKLFKVEKLIVEEEVLEKTILEVLSLMDKHNINAFNFKNRKGSVVSLSLRTNLKGEIQLTFITKEKVNLNNLINELVLNNKNIVSVYENFVPKFKTNIDIYNGKLELIKGSKYLEIELDKYKFYVTPFSFFQLNTAQANKLYQYILKNVSFNKNETVLEAFSGIGTIATFISQLVKQVVAIESIKDSINDMKYSLDKNKITNVKPIVGDAFKVIETLNNKFDKMIFDPPRGGLGKELCETIIKMKPKTIVYVSCNPLTLVDDLKILTKAYKIKTITPLDMFPQTSHVETITLLSLKTA